MAKKRPFDLNYEIHRDVDRCAATHDIINNLTVQPSESDLELLASYILYGKDENGKNTTQRKEITDSNTRYSSYRRISEQVQSLDEILENPLINQSELKPATERYIYTKKTIKINRPRYDKEGKLLDPGDSDIPGMTELWSAIDGLEKFLANNEDINSYRRYQLKHQLIDMRRHQYYLKDAYKPTLHFLKIDHPSIQLYDWDSDTSDWITEEEWRRRVDNRFFLSRNLADYETEIRDGQLYVRWYIRKHNFDWENSFHIRMLFANYASLYEQVWDHPQSWGRSLIFDFDRYTTLCDFNELWQHIILRKIDNVPYSVILRELQEKFGTTYTENHLGVIITKEIPNAIAKKAKELRLLVETPIENCKICNACKKTLPKHTLFFGQNITRLDGWASSCKACEKKRRLERGQSKNDKRFKKTNVPEVPPREG